VAGFFTSEASRRWWGLQNAYRRADTRRGEVLLRILKDEWMLATLREEARAAAGETLIAGASEE
jgi:hypothetical protein